MTNDINVLDSLVGGMSSEKMLAEMRALIESDGSPAKAIEVLINETAVGPYFMSLLSRYKDTVRLLYERKEWVRSNLDDVLWYLDFLAHYDGG